MVGQGQRGPHDLGGMPDFGAVPRDHEDHLPWHESVMRMLFTLVLLGLLRSSGEVRYFVETMPAEQYRTRSYYERWLVAVEALLDRVRRTDSTALTAAANAVSAEPLGLGDGSAPTARTSSQPESFAVGTQVKIRDDPPPGHNRLPMYARARIGTVRAVHPPEEVPGTPYENLHYEHVYNVAFRASDLWPDAHHGDEVHLDLFASYLRPMRSSR